MASSSTYAFFCVFLLASPLVFFSNVNASANTATFIQETCNKVKDKQTQKICSEYISGLLESELPGDIKVDHKNFTEGFIFGTTTAGYEMITKLGMSMIAMAHEKEQVSTELQACINSYETATSSTLAAFYSFKQKDYAKASSQMLQASTVVGNCEKALENQADLLESHKMYVQMAKLPVTFIDERKNSAKGSS